MVVGRLLSYWEGNFSGAMLHFGGVNHLFFQRDDLMKPVTRHSFQTDIAWGGKEISDLNQENLRFKTVHYPMRFYQTEKFSWIPLTQMMRSWVEYSFPKSIFLEFLAFLFCLFSVSLGSKFDQMHPNTHELVSNLNDIYIILSSSRVTSSKGRNPNTTAMPWTPWVVALVDGRNASIHS